MKQLKSASLLSKGYAPLPVPRGEKHPKGMKGWQKVLDWDGAAPGLGLNLRGLAMVDFDIRRPDDEATIDWVTKLAESVCKDAPLRYRAGSPSCALLVRVPELEAGTVPHTRLRTAKWEGDGVQAFVEVKMGAGHFMFGWGTHPEGDRLVWDLRGSGDAPHPDDFPAFDRLPEMTVAELVEHTKRLEGELAARFAPLQPLQRAGMVSGWKTRHDLSWDLEFEDDSGARATLQEVWDEVCRDPDGHAWVNLTPWRPGSDSMSGHVIASDATPGYPAIFDFAHQVQHFFDTEREMTDLDALELPAEIKPLGAVEAAQERSEPEAVSEDVKRAHDLHRLLYVRSRNAYLYNDDPEEVWMTEKAAFHGLKAKEKSELVCQVPAVQRTIWDPEQPPLATIDNLERGWREHNTYAPPAHERAGGTIEPFFAWLHRFLPDDDERAVVLDWLAHKVQRPWDRMFALVLVGEEGSGKGTLWKVVQKLWGARAVAQVGSIQSIYDARYQDMLYRALFVLVDEVASEDAIKVGRKVAHEKLKAFCEPQAGFKLLNLKGREQVHAKVCASVGIATNNINALPIGQRDRRFFVASTGAEMAPQLVQTIHTWLRHPANVAELYAWLEARDLSGFNAMRAPDSQAKEDMHATNITDVDAAVEALRAAVTERGGVCQAAQAQAFFELQALEHEDYTRAKKAFRRSFPTRVFRNDACNDGKAFRAHVVTPQRLQISGSEAWGSIELVYHYLDQLRQKADA